MNAERGSSQGHEARGAPEQISDSFAGLRTRLLVASGDFLDGKKDNLNAGEIEIKDFKDRNYDPYENTSLTDRQRFQRKRIREGGTTDFEAQRNEWEKNLTKSITYKKDGTTSLNDTLDPIFKKMDIGKDTDFTQAHASQIYDRYFPEEDKPLNERGVQLFVADVLAAYTEEGNDKPKIDKIKNNLDNIQNFAQIFGKDASKMVSQLILAEAEYINEPNKFKQPDQYNSNRINNLKHEEEAMLLQIQRAQKERDLERLISFHHRTEIQTRLQDEDTLLIIGGTGCGKTVGLPFMVRELLAEQREKDRQAGRPLGKFFITEPRILNADMLAEKVANDACVSFAGTAGEVDIQHSKREEQHGEKTYNPNANTVFFTEGSLVQRFLSSEAKDKEEIENLSYIMVDEVHEQNVDTELLLALVEKEQKRRREEIRKGDTSIKPLKLIVSSATVDEKNLTKYFTGANPARPEDPAIPVNIPGNMHKVTTHYLESTPNQRALNEAAVQRACDLIEGRIPDVATDGDIMIFASGEDNIDDIKKKIEERIKFAEYPSFLPPMKLLSGSNKDQKIAATEKREDGKRRIIISTNFAETGVTIVGLKHVIDTGLKKEKRFNAVTGLARLQQVPASEDECKQRKGRGGRTAPGFYYPLWTRDETERPDHPLPEMLRSDLANTILLLKNKNFDIRDLHLISELSTESITSTEDALIKIGALQRPEGSQRTEITRIGRQIERMQVDDVHVARMIIEARQHQPQLIDAMATMAALINESSIFMKDKNASNVQASIQSSEENAPDIVDPHSDFITLYKTYQAFLQHGSDKEWSERHGLDFDILTKINAKIITLLQKIKPKNTPEQKRPETEEDYKTLIGIIATGYQDRIMKLNTNENSGYLNTYLWERDPNISVNFNLRIGNRSVLPEKDPPHRIIAGDIYIPDNRKEGRLSLCQVIEEPTAELNNS